MISFGNSSCRSFIPRTRKSVTPLSHPIFGGGLEGDDQPHFARRPRPASYGTPCSAHTRPAVRSSDGGRRAGDVAAPRSPPPRGPSPRSGAEDPRGRPDDRTRTTGVSADAVDALYLDQRVLLPVPVPAAVVLLLLVLPEHELPRPVRDPRPLPSRRRRGGTGCRSVSTRRRIS